MSSEKMLMMRHVALGAGFFCIVLATFVQGILPAAQPESTDTKVTRVVRTDLGELKWAVADASDYTDLEAAGRSIYIREGCWYCHSQYVRPVTGETRRWGPVSQAGEYAFDLPHLFSTRRIGPDLTRVGLKYSDGWHAAHLYNPRLLVPDSIMPSFPWLFDESEDLANIVEDEEGRRTLEKTPATEAFFDFGSSELIYLTPNAEGLVYVHATGLYPVIITPNEEFKGEQVKILSGTEELKGLIAYLQKLGINRGKWRDLFTPQRVVIASASIPKSDEWISYGKQQYERRCEGCHGVSGDGNGPAATFLKVRPRIFTAGTFKFRMTPSGALPSDGDLLRTLIAGVRGTAMPSFHNLADKDRIAIVQYVKHELSIDEEDYAYFVEEEAEPPMYIGKPPAPSPKMIVQGKQVWQSAKCWECHGDGGKGDGEKAKGLEDDWGFPAPPADLTSGLFKSGADVADIYRTLSTGLNGTPMPAYSDSFEEKDLWALSYYVLSLSAFTDPLSLQPLTLSTADRNALNDPETKADSTDNAYISETRVRIQRQFGGDAWASKHGIEVAGSAEEGKQEDKREEGGE